MADPLLHAHEVRPGFFVLSSPLAPISVRDQMLRGQWLVERLLEEGRVLPCIGQDEVLSELPLAIVGAGAAGITGALTAAAGRVRVVVIDQAEDSFSRQAVSSTRWLDPMQYDWPAASWNHTKYPITGTAPLQYLPGRSSSLAASWRKTWNDRRRKYPQLLTALYKVSVPKINPIWTSSGSAPDSFDLTLSDGSVVNAQAIIWAAGFGNERAEIVDLRLPPASRTTKLSSPPFWGTDALESPGCGTSAPNPTVAILGGGDGAIQDALRALTKMKSVRDIYSGLGLPGDFGRSVMEAEERMHRHWIWSGVSGRRDHDMHVCLDAVHKNAVDEALKITGVRGNAQKMIVHPNEKILMYHRCGHLACYYALNRFLALIFDQVLRDLGGQLLVPNSSVINADRQGAAWNLDVVTHTECFKEIPVGSTPRCESADYVLVRYGIDGSVAMPPWPLGINLPRNRHSLPNNLSHV